MSSTINYNHVINNNDYLFKVTLVSIAGNSSRAQDIKPSAIKEFFISDTLNNFYQTGYIVIDNSYDIIERDTPASDPYTNPYYYNTAGNYTENTQNSDTGSTANIQTGLS